MATAVNYTRVSVLFRDVPPDSTLPAGSSFSTYTDVGMAGEAALSVGHGWTEGLDVKAAWIRGSGTASIINISNPTADTLTMSVFTVFAHIPA